MNLARRAFTLIELLVVIAIIAILAAILFPVFAQAKAAAKASASLSNDKQTTLAALMYAGDTDDMLTPSQTWNGDGFITYSGKPYAPWPALIHPYTKNSALQQDPLGPSLYKIPGITDVGNETAFGLYGYNHANLAPTDFVGDELVSQPLSATTPANPAETVMFTSGVAWLVETDGYISADEAGYDFLYFTLVDPPNCYNDPGYAPGLCMDNWGTGSLFDTLAGIKTKVAGRDTGGVSLRASGGSIVSFTDGHVKKMKPGALAAGTNWNENIAAENLQTTDETKYLWDSK